MFLRSATGERGSATVEMAISMLVIVPIVLYALFLDDLLRFRLDAQEAAVSSVWDFTVRNYQQGRTDKPSGKITQDSQVVQNVDRLVFCDHSSAFDTFKASQDCDDPRHHQAVAGHACWLIKGSEQVTCRRASATLGFNTMGIGLSTSFAKKYNRGGFFTCEARESVLNYLIPKKFMSQFTKVQLTDKKKYAGNVHTAAGSAGAGDVFRLPTEQLGLLADTWAMNDIPDMDPWSGAGSGAQKEFYDRVNTLYRGNFGYVIFAGAGSIFFAQGVGAGILPLPYVQTPLISGPMGDNPFVPHMSLKKQTGKGGQKQKIQQESGTATYFDQGWDKSGTGDANYKGTYDARGQYYLGHKKPESNQ